MTAETRARDTICALAKSPFDRGLTFGGTGNIGVRLDDGGWLMTPTTPWDPRPGLAVAASTPPALLAGVNPPRPYPPRQHNPCPRQPRPGGRRRHRGERRLRHRGNWRRRRGSISCLQGQAAC